MNTKDKKILLSDVEQTGLLTLYCKAVESESDNLIIHDKKAVAVAQKLDLFDPPHS
jgi:O-methyltransferase involved in polyketide biosynthesis